MKLLLFILVPFCFIQSGLLAQAEAPETATASSTLSPEVLRAIKMLTGAGWKDQERLEEELELVANSFPDIIAEDRGLAKSIMDMPTSSDLLMKAIFSGLLETSEKGIDCCDLLPDFFEKVAKTNDPEDLPDTSRSIWMNQKSMLLHLSRKIFFCVEGRSLNDFEELKEAIFNPMAWLKKMYPDRKFGDNSVTTEIHPPVKASPKLKTSALRERPEASPPQPKPDDKPDTSTSRSAIIALIVAAIGLLGFLIKKRRQ